MVMHYEREMAVSLRCLEALTAIPMCYITFT